jgi:hypothetical protein
MLWVEASRGHSLDSSNPTLKASRPHRSAVFITPAHVVYYLVANFLIYIGNLFFLETLSLTVPQFAQQSSDSVAQSRAADSQPEGDLFAAIDPVTPLAGKIVPDHLAVLDGHSAQTLLLTLQAAFLNRVLIESGRHRREPFVIVQRLVLIISLPVNPFEINKIADFLTITMDVSDLFSRGDLPRDTVEGQIGQMIGGERSAPFEELQEDLTQCLVLLTSLIPIGTEILEERL